jgi:hypothetical protein
MDRTTKVCISALLIGVIVFFRRFLCLLFLFFMHLRFLSSHVLGYTALHAACQNGYTKIVLWLLAIPGINIQRATFEKVTPLHSAMANRHAECVALLLAKGMLDAEYWRRNKEGEGI